MESLLIFYGLGMLLFFANCLSGHIRLESEMSYVMVCQIVGLSVLWPISSVWVIYWLVKMWRRT